MPNYKQVSGILLIAIVGLLTLIFQLTRVIDIMSDLTGIWVWIAAILLGIGTGLITRKTGKKPTTSPEMSTPIIPDRNFAHLTIHYSQKTDNLDMLIDSAQPRYVTNNRTKQFFLVPSWLKPYIHQHKISPQSHDGERALRKYISTYSGDKSATEPDPRQLGLMFNEKNELILAQEYDIVSKLGGHKLEDLRVVFLHRIHARRTLLLKKSTKEAFAAPMCILELTARGIIADSEDLGMRPWENCNRWSKRQHYTFHPERYPESELTKGL